MTLNIYDINQNAHHISFASDKSEATNFKQQCHNCIKPMYLMLSTENKRMYAREKKKTFTSFLLLW